MRTLCFGLAASLAPGALFMFTESEALLLLAALAVFVVGLAVEIGVALAAVRSGRSPFRPVLRATACYWLGAAAGSTLAWTALLSSEFGYPVEAGLSPASGNSRGSPLSPP